MGWNEKAARRQLCKLVDPKAPKAELRVEIAKDVIAGLMIKKLVPRGGYTYFESEDRTPLEGDAQEFLSHSNGITVCALGGLFAAYVARFDEFELDGIVGIEHRISRDKVFRKLREIFPSFQMSDIEGAFEGYDCRANWVATYPDSRERLVAICENIVRNGGTFKMNDFGG